jgi:hypothetical protein
MPSPFFLSICVGNSALAVRNRTWNQAFEPSMRGACGTIDVESAGGHFSTQPWTYSRPAFLFVTVD